MHCFPTYPAILALLVGEALAATYYEGSFQSITESAHFPKTGNRSKTVVVTVTQTTYVTQELPSSNTAPHEDSSSSSGFAVPPLPDSVTHPSKESDYSSATGAAATIPTPKASTSSLSGFHWPTRIATISSDVVVMPSAGTSGSAMVSPPAPDRSSPSKTDAELSVSPTISVHPLCKAKPIDTPNAEAPVKRNLSSSLTDFSILHPTNLGWITRYIDTAVKSDMENNTPSTSMQKRAEESKARPRRTSYWSRFFAIAQPVLGSKVVKECLACDYEGQVTCLPNGKYTWCRGGCVVVEKLGCDMVCEGGGQIQKEGMYCVR